MILLFVCTCVLVQIGNGANSLRELRAGLERGDRRGSFSPEYKRQRQDSASSIRVVKYLADNENEHNQSQSLETAGQNDTASNPDGNEKKEDQGKSHSQQQDEDYVMDRPDSKHVQANS